LFIKQNMLTRRSATTLLTWTTLANAQQKFKRFRVVVAGLVHVGGMFRRLQRRDPVEIVGIVEPKQRSATPGKRSRTLAI
jgi:hypothetical protein